MKRIQAPTATSSLPAAAESGTTGYFTQGDPAVPTPATVVTPEWLNRVQEEICGTIEGAGLTLDGADNSQLAQAIVLIAQAYATPTGAVQHYFGTTPPAGWLARDGSTIGAAGSGATGRANADTEALFTLIWNNTSNTGDFVIQDSSGTPTTRGASAAADFAALMRIPLPDDRGNFDRGLNTSESGTDPGRTLASHQDDALQNITGTVATFANGSLGQNWHVVPDTASGAFAAGPGSGSMTSGGGSFSTNYKEVDFDASRVARTSTETRPDNRAYLPIIKL